MRTSDGFEVDFLAPSPVGATSLIQVCADASDPNTAARELRALLEARPLYSDATALLLTLTRDGLPQSVPDGIVAMPAYEWMLAG